MQRVITFWNKGWMGKAVLSVVGLLLGCCVIGIFAPRSSNPQALAPATAIPTYNDFPARPPTDVAVTTEPTDAPTAEVLATLATDIPATPTKIVLQNTATTAPEPTSAPAPTAKPKPTTKPAPAVAVEPTAKPASAPIPTAVDVGAAPCQPGQIKGNRKSGIYHVPGQRDYAKTYANVQCFDTEAEAKAAGYRKAQR